MYTINPANKILEKVSGEEIEAIVFGDGGDDFIENNTLERGRIYKWEEVVGVLSHEFDCDFGSDTLPGMNAWTKSYIIFVSEYDGSTSVGWFYRNPTAYEPHRP